MMTNEQACKVTFEESGHVAYECPGEHEDGGWTCMFCAGGLFSCTRCGSFEGGTTTHCPGEQMGANINDAVYAGQVDYREGEWVPVGSPHTPARGWEIKKEWFE